MQISEGLDGIFPELKRHNRLQLHEIMLPIGPTKHELQQVYNFRVGIFAFHKALCDQPRDPLVVAAFSLAVHNGGDIIEAVNIARRIIKPHDTSFYELQEPRDLDSHALTNEVMDFTASVKCALRKMTNEHIVSLAMAGYPKAPYSDLVSKQQFLFRFNFMKLNVKMLPSGVSLIDGSNTYGGIIGLKITWTIAPFYFSLGFILSRLCIY